MTSPGIGHYRPHIDFPFDIESYPNVFSAVFIRHDTDTMWVFEVSERKNQSRHLIAFLHWLRAHPEVRMVGFNSLGYDYPVLHHLLTQFPNGFTAADVYQKSMQIIETDWNDRFRNTIRPRDVLIRQVDLMKVHHFDNAARSTSLKKIEIAQRMDCVADLPYSPGTVLTAAQIPDLLGYNIHDVRATGEFLIESAGALEFRDEMSAELGEDLTNVSDTNIGSKVFIHEMEQVSPGICGRPGSWRQTPRSQIALAECILPTVSFSHPEFRRVHEYLSRQVITKTKGVFDGLTANAFGMTFAFGTGGIHGAVENRTWRSTPERVIQGRDVASYYPNLAIANRIYPEHLSDVFCDVYKRLYDRRIAVGKKTTQGAAIKLALNGTYGNSNSQFSPFYDPQYTMRITINGQLLLCMLAERLAEIPTLELIQVNTDGIEYAVDRIWVGACDHVSAEWERMTGLELEAENYDLFAQRDVNNYLLIDSEGGVKCKGAFEYQHAMDHPKPQGQRDGWHKNQSVKIIAMAAEALMVHGTPIAETVENCDNPFLFMHTLKVQKTDRVMLGGEVGTYEDHQSPPDAKGRPVKRKIHRGGVEQQKTGRYYMTRDGAPLFKIMPPLARLPHHYRPQTIQSGFMVAMCNDLHDFDWSRLDRGWYVRAAEDLVKSTGFYD